MIDRLLKLHKPIKLLDKIKKLSLAVLNISFLEMLSKNR